MRTKLIDRYINEDTRLLVPDAQRMLPIKESALSASLRHALADRGFDCLADLHGFDWLDVVLRLGLSRTHARELFDTYARVVDRPNLAAEDVAAGDRELSVRDLDLSRRAVNVLWANGIRTVSQLTTLDYDRAIGFRNAGKKTAKEIMDCIEQLNARTHPVTVTPAASTRAGRRD